MTTLTLRPETNEDRPVVATMLARTYGTEAVKAIELVGKLRTQESFNPDLALVVEQNGKAMASALLMPVQVAEQGAVVLASLAFDTKQEGVEPLTVLDAVLAKVASTDTQFVLMRGNATDFAAQGFVKAEGMTFTNSTETDWLVKTLASAPANGAVTLPDVLVK